jgi:hypothetical protein
MKRKSLNTMNSNVLAASPSIGSPCFAPPHRAGLIFGTSLERIGDESLTLASSLFVHCYIWDFGYATSPYAESSRSGSVDDCGRLLTFAGFRSGGAWIISSEVAKLMKSFIFLNGIQ